MRPPAEHGTPSGDRELLDVAVNGEARQREQRKRNEGKYRKAQAARKEGVR